MTKKQERLDRAAAIATIKAEIAHDEVTLQGKLAAALPGTEPASVEKARRSLSAALFAIEVASKRLKLAMLIEGLPTQEEPPQAI